MIVTLLGERAGIKVIDARERGDNLVHLLHSEYQWRKVRNAHVKDESCCQMCNILRELEVHHVKPWHLAPELRYDRTNLITLCRDCHFRFGHYLNWRGQNPYIRELCAEARLLKEKWDNEENNAAGNAVVVGAGRVHACASPVVRLRLKDLNQILQ